MSMDSLSKLSRSTGSSSFPIRAPLTVDSDSDYDSEYSTNAQKNIKTRSFSSDNSGFESEGYLSGDNEFDTATKMPFVAHPDEEICQETSVNEEFVVSRPFLTDPDEEIIEETSHVEEFVVSRPFVSNPDRIIIEDNVNVASRPFVANTNEESFTTASKEEDEYDRGIEKKVMDTKVLPLAKAVMPPIAQLSGHSDEDSVGSVVEEDDGFWGVVRIPSSGILENLTAPKVQVLGVEEGDQDESQFEAAVESEVVENSILGQVPKGNLGSDEFLGVIKVPGSGNLEKLNAPKVQVLGIEVGDQYESHFEGVVESEVVEDSISSQVLIGLLDCDEEKVIVENDFVKDSIPVGLVDQSQFEVVLESEVVEDSISGQVLTGLLDCYEKTVIAEKNSVMDSISAGLVEGKNPDVTDDDSIPGQFLEGLLGCDEEKVITEDSGRDSTSVGLVEDEDPDATDDSVLGQVLNGHLGYDEEKAIDEKNSLGDPLSAGLVEDEVTGVINETISKSPVESEVSILLENLELDENVKYLGEEIQALKNMETLPESYEKNSMNSGYYAPLECDSIHGKELVEGGQVAGTGDDEVKSVICLAIDSPSPEVDEDAGPTNKADVVVDEMQLEANANRIIDEESVSDVHGEEILNLSEDVALISNIINCANEESAKVDKNLQLCAECANNQTCENNDDDDDDATESIIERETDSPRSTEGGLMENELHGKSDRSEGDCNLVRLNEGEECPDTIQQLRVRYLEFVQRLGLSPEDPIASLILRQLDLASTSISSRGSSPKSAERVPNENGSNFSLNILIIGKSGVGKSATINSIVGEEKAVIDPFEPATTSVKEIVGTIYGMKVRILDTPGFVHSQKDQSENKKILESIKRFTKKCPPDVVLYVDRLDMQTTDFTDIPLLRLINSFLGPSTLRNSVIALTHATSNLPDDPCGSPLSYDAFVAERSQFFQRLIRRAVGDSLTNLVYLVENHRLCQKDEYGQALLPNGVTWRPQLMLLCYSIKIISEANSIINAQVPFQRGKLLGFRVPSLPPLPDFLSSLLKSFAHPKLSVEHFPAVGFAEVTINKKEFKCYIYTRACSKYWENGSEMAGLFTQTIGEPSQIFMGLRSNMVSARCNRGSRPSCSELLQIALVGLLPVSNTISRKLLSLVSGGGVLKVLGE